MARKILENKKLRVVLLVIGVLFAIFETVHYEMHQSTSNDSKPDASQVSSS
jgi:hypothetical protein